MSYLRRSEASYSSPEARFDSSADHVAHMKYIVVLGHGFKRVRKVAKSDC